MVFGGASAVWEYEVWIDAFWRNMYDAQCSLVQEYVRRSGFSCITGGNILVGMVVDDDIGHPSYLSMPVLIEFFRILARWGMARSGASGASASRL